MGPARSCRAFGAASWRDSIVAIRGALRPITAIAAAVAPAPADARGRPLGRPVMTAGTCSDGATTFKLKSMFDDTPFPQTVGAELEVDSGVVGQTWDVTLTDNGVVFFAQPVETIGDGAFTVTQPDQGAFSVSHTITATATNRGDGTVCTGTVVDQPIR